jgi:hypothetical protein
MKKLGFICLLLCLFGMKATFSQNVKMPIDSASKLITYTEVAIMAGTKDTLYNRALKWINSFYKNPNDVTKVRDILNGKLELIHRIKVTNTSKDGVKTDGPTFQYTLTFNFKEGKYRFTFTKFNLKAASYFPLERWLNPKDPQYNIANENYLNQLDTEIKEIIKGIKKGMLPPIVKNDNW